MGVVKERSCVKYAAVTSLLCHVHACDDSGGETPFRMLDIGMDSCEVLVVIELSISLICKSFYKFWIPFLYIANIISLLWVGCLFTPLMEPSHEQKFLNFNEIQFIHCLPFW